MQRKAREHLQPGPLKRVQPRHTLISGFGRRTDFYYFKPSSLWSLDMYGCPRIVTHLPSFKYTYT